MRLTLALWRIEWKLLWLLFWESVLLNRMCLILLFEFPVFALMVRYWAGRLDSRFVACYAGVICAVAMFQLVQAGGDDVEGIPPFTLDLRTQPKLTGMLGEVRKEMAAGEVKSVSVALSPVAWRTLGCDSRRTLETREMAIPLGCLSIWSVRDFRCHAAYWMVRRRPPAWIFRRVRASMERLALMMRLAPALRSTTMRDKLMAPFIRQYPELLAGWGLLADLQADDRMARVYGASSVAVWLERSYIADFLVRRL